MPPVLDDPPDMLVATAERIRVASASSLERRFAKARMRSRSPIAPKDLEARKPAFAQAIDDSSSMRASVQRFHEPGPYLSGDISR